MDEQQKLDAISRWYSNQKWGFYTRLVHYDYQTLKPFFRPGALLEVGPADGEMTKLLLPDFSDYTVIDAAKKYVTTVTGLSPRITGFVSMIEDFQPPHPYDTIMCAHILEHVRSPIPVLRRLSLMLKPGGRLLVVVPNALSLHRQAGVAMGMLKKVTELNEADRSVDHKRVYTPQMLRSHARQAKLQVIASGGIFLKPLSNSQIEAQWTPELMDAYYRLGFRFPALASEIYVILEAYDKS